MPSNWLVGAGGGLLALADQLSGLSARDEQRRIQQMEQAESQRRFDEGVRQFNLGMTADRDRFSATHGLAVARDKYDRERDTVADNRYNTGLAITGAKEAAVGDDLSAYLPFLQGTPGMGLVQHTPSKVDPMKALGQTEVPGIEGLNLPGFQLGAFTDATNTRKELPADIVAKLDRDMRKWEFENAQNNAMNAAADRDLKNTAMTTASTWSANKRLPLDVAVRLGLDPDITYTPEKLAEIQANASIRVNNSRPRTSPADNPNPHINNIESLAASRYRQLKESLGTTNDAQMAALVNEGKIDEARQLSSTNDARAHRDAQKWAHEQMVGFGQRDPGGRPLQMILDDLDVDFIKRTDPNWATIAGKMDGLVSQFGAAATLAKIPIMDLTEDQKLAAAAYLRGAR
jgi:hypothetical protein